MNISRHIHTLFILEHLLQGILLFQQDAIAFWERDKAGQFDFGVSVNTIRLLIIFKDSVLVTVITGTSRSFSFD